MTGALARRRTPSRRLAPGRLGTLIWLPFLAVSLVHLSVKAAGWIEGDRATKALLMPTLVLVAVVLGAAVFRRGAPRPSRPWPLAVLVLALLLSWVGDLTVENLPVGLGFFLAAHLAFTAAFLLAVPGRPPRWTPIYAVWWVAFVVVLAPRLGSLLVPVSVYGLALGAMAVVVSRTGAIGAAGAAAFVASDSLLAIRLFTPALHDRVSDVAIMALYLVAQGLLVAAFLRSLGPIAGAGQVASDAAAGVASRG